MNAAATDADLAPAEAAFASGRARVTQALDALVARCLASDRRPVAEAIRYSLAGEGKRLRAVLVIEAYRAAGGTGDVTPLAAAVEVVHAYSLVHDDLPCMDDDDLRRGRPTVHRAFDVRIATAAGMAMVPLAASAAAEAALALGLPAPTRARILGELMRAAGAGGMIGGQLLDLEWEGQAATLDDLRRIHRLKTGALIESSLVIGGLAAGADDALVSALARYGAGVGLAFQITDDVLDVTSTSDQLGKTAGKDVQYGKSTYPALLGLDGARARATALVDEAREALRAQRALTPELDALARFTVARTS